MKSCISDATCAPLVGLKQPELDVLDAPFWHGLAKGQVRLQRCAGCGQWSWPPQWRCGACGSWDFAWPEITPNGVVYSYAHAHHTTVAEMRGLTPYTTLLVALPEAGGARLLGLLIGDSESLAIGRPVTGVIQHAADAAMRPALRWRLDVPPCGPTA